MQPKDITDKEYIALLELKLAYKMDCIKRMDADLLYFIERNMYLEEFDYQTLRHLINNPLNIYRKEHIV